MENQALMKLIREIHQGSNQTYGSPRITQELLDCRVKVSRPRVARLMQKAGIRSKMRKKYVVTTDSKHKFPIVDNFLDRDFKVGEIGRVWVSDITYIPTAQGWLYLTTVIDLGDRKVIGWSLSSSMTAIQTSIAAFRMAVNNRFISKELIFHSDRGVQYACNEFTGLLKAYPKVRQSMSRKGNC